MVDKKRKTARDVPNQGGSAEKKRASNARGPYRERIVETDEPERITGGR
jgi:hypothetical protein